MCVHTRAHAREHAADPDEKTASEWGRLDLVERALDRGAKPTAADAGGYTALHYAAQRNHAAVCNLLLNRGALVNASACGATPLHRAAHAGAKDAVAVLLARGGDPSAVDTSFASALPLAVDKARAQGHAEVERALLAAHSGISKPT